MDRTIEYMLPAWIENMAHNKNLKSLDDFALEKPDFDRIKRIIIEGTGPSRSAVNYSPSNFVVGNQSSFGLTTDMIVVTDAQAEVARKIHKIAYYREPMPPLVMATICHPGCVVDPESTFGFIHKINAMENPVYKLLNLAMQLAAGKLMPFIVQSGCSMNAALLVVDWLITQEQLPNVPIYLAGVDFAWPTMAAVPEGINVVLSDLGKLTTDQFLHYARNLNMIANSSTFSREVYCVPAPWNLTSEFIPQKDII